MSTHAVRIRHPEPSPLERQQATWASGDFSVIGTTLPRSLVVPSEYLEVAIARR